MAPKRRKDPPALRTLSSRLLSLPIPDWAEPLIQHSDDPAEEQAIDSRQTVLREHQRLVLSNGENLNAPAITSNSDAAAGLRAITHGQAPSQDAGRSTGHAYMAWIAKHETWAVLRIGARIFHGDRDCVRLSGRTIQLDATSAGLIPVATAQRQGWEPWQVTSVDLPRQTDVQEALASLIDVDAWSDADIYHISDEPWLEESDDTPAPKATRRAPAATNLRNARKPAPRQRQQAARQQAEPVGQVRVPTPALRQGMDYLRQFVTLPALSTRPATNRQNPWIRSLRTNFTLGARPTIVRVVSPSSPERCGQAGDREARRATVNEQVSSRTALLPY